MLSGDRLIQVYEELADREDQRGSQQLRDRYLMLAADAALTVGKSEDAERLRGRLLEFNPHHLTKPFGTLQEALSAPDVVHYLSDLRDTYPPALVEKLHAAQPITSPAPRKEAAKTMVAAGIKQERREEAAANIVAHAAATEEEPPAESPGIESMPEEEPSKIAPAPSLPNADVFFKGPLKADKPASPPPVRSIILDQGPAPNPAPAPTLLAPKPKVVFPKPAPPADPVRLGHASPYQASPLAVEETPAPETDTRLSYWVGTLLFIILLVAGLALAGYTLVKPFLNG